MASDYIEASSESISGVEREIQAAAEGYKTSLKRLENLIGEITSGDIQGDPANDLLNKFQAKQETFSKLAKTLDEAEEFMGGQGTKFNNMIGDLSAGMR